MSATDLHGDVGRPHAEPATCWWLASSSIIATQFIDFGDVADGGGKDHFLEAGALAAA
jgi:hypothetical protein